MRFQDEHYYHVYNRGARKSALFFSQENYQYFLRLLVKNSEKYRVQIIAYCLMPNHFHLLLYQNSGGNISKTMQTTFNSYSQALNKENNLSGSLFQGKPKSVSVESDEYCVHLARYIHLNPVKAKITNLPEQWVFSDYADWINGAANNELRDVLFGNADNYRAFVMNAKEPELNIKKLLIEDDASS